VEWVGIDWIHLARQRDGMQALVHAVIKFGFHKIRRISWVLVSFSRRTLLHGL